MSRRSFITPLKKKKTSPRERAARKEGTRNKWQNFRFLSTFPVARSFVFAIRLRFFSWSVAEGRLYRRHWIGRGALEKSQTNKDERRGLATSGGVEVRATLLFLMRDVRKRPFSASDYLFLSFRFARKVLSTKASSTVTSTLLATFLASVESDRIFN